MHLCPSHIHALCPVGRDQYIMASDSISADIEHFPHRRESRGNMYIYAIHGLLLHSQIQTA